MHGAQTTQLVGEGEAAAIGTTLRPAARARRRPGRPPLEVEFVMPSQFHVPAGEAWHQGEKRLMLAVLKDAVDILSEYAMAYQPRRRQLFAKTIAWVAADEATWPFSFVSICDTLGFDIASLRKVLARRVEAAYARPPERRSRA